MGGEAFKDDDEVEEETYEQRPISRSRDNLARLYAQCRACGFQQLKTWGYCLSCEETEWLPEKDNAGG
jgi:hypothetical protein